MRKRIGIDFHQFDGKYQGSRTHLYEILSRIVTLESSIDYYIFLADVDGLKRSHRSFERQNVKLIHMPPLNSLKRIWWALPKFKDDLRLDLVHTQYVGPVFYNFKYITTIHDILFEKYPEYFSPLFNLRSKIFIRASAKKSAHVFTVSEYSKRELVATYNLDEENVTVINNGVDINRFKPDIFLGNSLEKRGIEPGYVLTVGRLEPRKNHKAIIEAYALAGADLPRLVIVGQRDFKYKEIFELVEKYKLKDKVIFLDDVTDDELPEVYRGAKIFLYPSWAEGFGVPPLEAMASGVPVICSNSTALPEVVGEAGLLCPPQDPPELLRKMKSVLVDPTLQQEMRGRGLRRANMFTWEAAAGKMLEGYEAVLRRRD